MDIPKLDPNIFNRNCKYFQETRVCKGKGLTYVNKLDAVLLNGVEGDGDVLEGVGLGLWSLVVSKLPFLQRLHQGN